MYIVKKNKEWLNNIIEVLNDIGVLKSSFLPPTDQLDQAQKEKIYDNFPKVFEVVAKFIVNPQVGFESRVEEGFENIDDWVQLIKDNQSAQQKIYVRKQRLSERANKLMKEGKKEELIMLQHDYERKFNSDNACTIESDSFFEEFDMVESITYKKIGNSIIYPPKELFEQINEGLAIANEIETYAVQSEENSEEILSLPDPMKWEGNKYQLAEVIYCLKKCGRIKTENNDPIEWDQLLNWINNMISNWNYNKIADIINNEVDTNKILYADKVLYDPAEDKGRLFFIEKELIPHLHEVREKKIADLPGQNSKE